jgi:hypothetical protein
MGLKNIIDGMKKDAAEVPTTPDGEIADLGEAFWQYLTSISETKDERRVPGYHPSQMYGFCPRKEVLAHYFPKPEADYIEPGLQMIFDWGTAWHWLTQNHYFGPMGVLWGVWKCNECAKSVEGFMPEPHKLCHPRHSGKGPKRGGYWTYVEPHVYNKEWNIPGHGDGILIMNRKPEGKRSLLEVKTMNGDMFKYLTKPDEKYIFQINIYLWLLGFDECWLTYWSKDARQGKPKVFRIKFDPEIPKEAQRRIQLHRRVWPTKRLCEGICKTDTDKHAQKCAHRGECFRQDIDLVVERLMKAKMGELPL